MTFCNPYLSTMDSNPTSTSSILTSSSTSSSLSSYIRASFKHHWTHRGFSCGGSSSHTSHLRGRPESGSLKTSLDGQEALQTSHSLYSFPSMTYLSLPAHSALAYSPAYTGR